MGFDVKVIADSIGHHNHRITTMLLTYPRFIHSELMTHRVFSRNAASSRAIPIMKMIKAVWSDPAMPVRWGKTGKGMQDHGVLTGFRLHLVRFVWRLAGKVACAIAWLLYMLGLHKQIANRVLEPWAWMTTLVTSTEWENFFSLRVHKDAQPEFQYLASMMLWCYINSKPAVIGEGGWHIPFGDQVPLFINDGDGIRQKTLKDQLKIATARAARTSYLTITGSIDVIKDFELHDKLAASGHWSPFEHAAQCMDSGRRSGNFTGWSQYRKEFPTENRSVDLHKLHDEYMKAA